MTPRQIEIYDWILENQEVTEKQALKRFPGCQIYLRVLQDKRMIYKFHRPGWFGNYPMYRPVMRGFI